MSITSSCKNIFCFVLKKRISVWIAPSGKYKKCSLPASCTLQTARCSQSKFFISARARKKIAVLAKTIRRPFRGSSRLSEPLRTSVGEASSSKAKKEGGIQLSTTVPRSETLATQLRWLRWTYQMSVTINIFRYPELLWLLVNTYKYEYLKKDASTVNCFGLHETIRARY